MVEGAVAPEPAATHRLRLLVIVKAKLSSRDALAADPPTPSNWVIDRRSGAARRLSTLHRGTVRAIMLQPHRSQISLRCTLKVLNPTDPHLIRRRQLHAPVRHQRRQRHCPAAAVSQWQQAVDPASGKAYYW